MKRILLIVGAVVLLLGAGCTILVVVALVGAGHSSASWTQKAVASVDKASKDVGGFSADDRKLYAAGLRHIANVHGHLGAFTIGQVIDDERTRESQVATARKDQTEQQAVDGEADDMKAMFATLNEGGAGVTHYKFEGKHLNVTIDADRYNLLSNQDKTLLKKTIYGSFAVSYNQRHGVHESGFFLNIYDLTGSIIDSYF